MLDLTDTLLQAWCDLIGSSGQRPSREPSSSPGTGLECRFSWTGGGVQRGDGSVAGKEPAFFVGESRGETEAKENFSQGRKRRFSRGREASS